MSKSCAFRLFVFSVIMLFAAVKAQAQSETVIHSFSGPDGAYPYVVSLTVGPDGALYGTTTFGGGLGDCVNGGCGTVFKLTGSGNNWTETVLWSFSGSPDGAYPESNVVFDRYGALYGTTIGGGNPACPQNNGCGTVFKLTPSSGPTWNETVLYRFSGTPDGEYPAGEVVFGPNGALYSTTYSGGTDGEGTVFQLAPSGGATWNETVLHSFGTTPNDGAYPYASGVIFGPDGALYGTTEYGGGLGDCGDGGCGTVFRLAPGTWAETVIHSFSGGSDGSEPYDAVTFGPDGALYGTTAYGGTASYCSGCGTVFRLAPSPAGSELHWTETVIYAFGGQPGDIDGYYPYAGVIFDRNGALYGTTYYGGTDDGGTVFKLTPTRAGGWSERVLHSFAGDPDGAYPYTGSLTFGRDGALYGTTEYGGTSNEGAVFQQAP